MRTFLDATTVALLVGGCTGQVSGNGQSQTQARTVGDFSQVQNMGSLDVTVTPAATSVSITADSNLLPLITTVVSNGGLVIDETKSLSSSLKLSAAVTTPTLTGIDDVGSGSLSAAGFTSDNFTIRLTGAGAVSFEGSVAALTLNVEGSGSTQLTGSSTGLQATIEGSGSVDGMHFRVVGPAQVVLRGSGGVNLVLQGDSSLEVDGAGSLNVALDGGTTNFTVTGSGTITWSGQTTVGQTNVTGSGSVRHQ